MYSKLTLNDVVEHSSGTVVHVSGGLIILAVTSCLTVDLRISNTSGPTVK